MLLIVYKLAIILPPIRIYICTPAMLLILFELTIIEPTISIDEFSYSLVVHLVVDPPAGILLAVVPSVHPVTIDIISTELPLINTAILPFECALPLLQPLPVVPLVLTVVRPPLYA